MELRLFEDKYSFVSNEDNRTIALILILQRYLIDTVVGYFHLPLALSHSLSIGFQLYTWGWEKNAMHGCIFNCVVKVNSSNTV